MKINRTMPLPTPPAHCHLQRVSPPFSYQFAPPPSAPTQAMLIMRHKRTTHTRAHTNNGNESEILIYGALDAIRYFHYPIYCLPASQPADKLPLTPTLFSLFIFLSCSGTSGTNLLQLLCWLIPILIAAAMRFMCALMILTLMMRCGCPLSAW